MIKLVIFDLGNVIVDFKNDWFFRHLSEKTGISEKKISAAMSGLLEKEELGRLSGSDTDRISKERLNLKGDLGFIRYHHKSARLNRKVLALAIKLKKNYDVAILSNVTRRVYRDKGSEYVNMIGASAFTSYSLHLRKPDPKIYRYVLKKCDVKPNEALFIDDMKENIDAARKVGMNGIVFTDYANLLKSMKKFGISV